MFTKKNNLFLIGLAFLLTSCIDLFETRYEIFENYYVSSDPAEDCKTLYYKITNDLSFERIQCIEKAGQIKGFIIVQKGTQYQYLKIDRDKPNDLGDTDVRNNISRKLNKKEFQNFLDSLNISNFKFSYSK